MLAYRYWLMANGRAHGSDEERVAHPAWPSRHHIDADIAARARTVLDDEGLVELLLKLRRRRNAQTRRSFRPPDRARRSSPASVAKPGFGPARYPIRGARGRPPRETSSYVLSLRIRSFLSFGAEIARYLVWQHTNFDKPTWIKSYWLYAERFPPADVPVTVFSFDLGDASK